MAGKDKGGIVVVTLQNAAGEKHYVFAPTNNVDRFAEDLRFEDSNARESFGYHDSKILHIEKVIGKLKILETFEYQEKEFFTQKEITDEYLAFPIEKQLAITNSAISYMQEYNGRSVFACKAMAMGYSNTEGETDTWTKNKK